MCHLTVTLGVAAMLVSGWNEASSVKPDFPRSPFWASLLLFSCKHFLTCARVDVNKCHHLCTVASSRGGLFSVTACLLGHPICLDRVITLLHPLPSCTFSFLRRPTRKNFPFFPPLYTSPHEPEPLLECCSLRLYSKHSALKGTAS